MASLNSRRAAVVAAVFAGAAAAAAAADVLGQLGITADVARQQVISGVESGFINYSVAAKAFKAAPAPLRAQLATGVVGWAKTFVASAEFKAKYAEVRNAHKPTAPAFEGTPEEEFQRMLDKQAKEFERSKQELAKLDPEVRKQVEAGLNQAAAAMRQLDTPEMRKMQLAGIRHSREEATARHEDAMRKWQADYPENPNLAMARRLKTFLEVSADVDYAARLEQRNGQMRFVNEAYEDKSSEWKLCYRVGKDAVDAARTAAAAWLRDLESAKPATGNQRP
jgi:hypothetical protein